MIKLTRDELRLWESVYASCHSGRRGMDAQTASGHADDAVTDRRDRFEYEGLPNSPYRPALGEKEWQVDHDE